MVAPTQHQSNTIQKKSYVKLIPNNETPTSYLTLIGKLPDSKVHGT